MLKGKGIIVFTILFLIFSFSNNVFSENIKIKSDKPMAAKIPVEGSASISISQKQVEIDGEKPAAKSKPAPANAIKGASVFNGNGKTVSNPIHIKKSNNIKRIQSPGKSVKAESSVGSLRVVGSEEIKKLQDKRQKRKSNFEKSLEKSEARKSLANRRMLKSTEAE